MLGRNCVVLDLETTGVQPGVDEIIEIGAVKLMDGEIIERYQQLIRPHRNLNLAIQRLTGIVDADLVDQPEINEILPQFVAFVGNLPVVAHNAEFDLGFLSAALGKPFASIWLDTVELARLAFPLAPNYRLAGLAQYLKLTAVQFHRALQDAETTAQLLLRCLTKLATWDLTLIHQLNSLLEADSRGMAVLCRELERNLVRHFPNRLLRPGSLCLAQDSSEEGLFARQQEATRQVPADAEIAAILGPQGPFAQAIPNYQYRSGQVKMLEGVMVAFAQSRNLVVEAGTGTGKSMAYLVPAVAWASSQQEKVVIATHTINLQEQLWEKDLPLLRKLLPFEFSAALVKGRSNYICLRKWLAVWSELEQISCEDKYWLTTILVWLSETTTGDRVELSLGRTSQDLWHGLAADSESCLGSRCRFYNGGCFVVRARRKAERADILIVNHSLLLSDAKTDNLVLPDYSYLIIDEAHHLEDSATEHLGSEVSDTRLEHFWRLLRLSGAPPGLLGQIKHRLPGLAGRLAQAELEQVEEGLQNGVELLGAVQDSSRDFFGSLEALARNLGTRDNGLLQVRLKENATLWNGWTALNAARENLSMRLQAISDCLTKISQALAEAEDEELAGLVRDINSLATQAKELGETVWQLLDLERANYVVWIELDGRNCRLRSAPVEVGPLLREMVFAKTKAAVLTSATLAVNNSFEHFLTRVGLASETAFLQVDSPFRYEDQALLCIPRDLPDPSQTSEENYTQAVALLLVDLVRTVGGRTLVLFTSHKMLREVYWQVKPYLETDDIQVLGHNLDGNRGKLVEEFKANARSVLLGASSFWEGVDIQGDALSCVVIVKLPFWPPTMPTVEARMEELAKQRQDGFRVLSIPQAVIRLKQGFGRLIRTQEDRGVVVILDNRILDKSYGRKFLNSLPLKTHVRGDSELVLYKIREWLEHGPTVHNLRLVHNAAAVLKEIQTSE